MTKRNNQGKLEAIWLKRAHRGPMDTAFSASFSPEKGLVGTVDRSRRRQVTILDADAWETAAAELGQTVDPIYRRANLLVRGIDLEKTRGRVLRIGAHARLVIGGETTPCERMDEVAPGLRKALGPKWRAGAFAAVLTAGEVLIGDEVSWEG